MPLPIDVVIVAETESSFAGIKTIAGLNRPGISPSFTFATIENSTSEKFTRFDKLNHSSVGYWIALDNVSQTKCYEIINKLKSDNEYNRGFYDTHLPNPVALATNMDELQNIADYVWNAFCATS